MSRVSPFTPSKEVMPDTGQKVLLDQKHMIDFNQENSSNDALIESPPERCFETQSTETHGGACLAPTTSFLFQHSINTMPCRLMSNHHGVCQDERTLCLIWWIQPHGKEKESKPNTSRDA